MHLLRSKKFLCFTLIFTLLFGSTLLMLRHPNEDVKFARLADRIFQSEMTANTLSMHYTVADPAAYGISKYAPCLPCYSAGNRLSAAEALQQDLEALRHISQDHLSPDNLYTYHLLYNYLEQSLEGADFAYYDEPLSPASGMQSQLPILLAEYTFRCQADVEDYLALLDQTDEYFTSLACYEKEKKEAGLLQADTSIQQVIEQCYSILSEAELEKGNHFLQTTFAERIQTLVTTGLLTAQEADSYIAQNDRLLTTVMQPAYEKLADELFLLMGEGTSQPKGLATLPKGQDYYSYLVRSTTGSSRTIQEIKELLYPQFEEEYQSLQNLLLSRTDSVEIWQRYVLDQDFPILAPEDMLTDLQARMAQDFPGFPCTSSPTAAVKQVSSSLAPYCAPAFYLTPPFDNADANVIYINPNSTAAGLELYTTLGHEGYPGHLYQTVYDAQKSLQQGTHPVRQLLWYGGYQEGWALYAEFLAYDYAIESAQESHMKDQALAWEIEKHSRSMQLCLYSLLDISIHYDNASYEEAHQVLGRFGISDPDTTRTIYDYVAETPANYLKYYLGYLEVLDLQAQARSLWQTEYTDLRFHRFFLDCGPSDFETLRQVLQSEIPF
ncbi:MAG: DUF885 domain-containing protein [Lachnospiraceae bacterium]|nr:DUF885 domain-containing protein [Lachnospiraceae bacterium]